MATILYLETFDEQGAFEGEHIPLQVKATDAIAEYQLQTEETFSFPVARKDYRLWREATMPMFLILYDAQHEEAYWLHIQEYDAVHKPTIAGDTINVHIPPQSCAGRTNHATDAAAKTPGHSRVATG